MIDLNFHMDAMEQGIFLVWSQMSNIKKKKLAKIQLLNECTVFNFIFQDFKISALFEV